MGIPTGYQPSATAKVWNIIPPSGPVKLALDVVYWQAALGNFVSFWLVQQKTDESWVYVGNVPPAGASDGNAGLIWELADGPLTIYPRPPGSGLAPVQGVFTDIANQVRDDMVKEWLSYIAALIQRIFYGAVPAPTGWPAASDTAAILNLQTFLHDHVEIVNGVPTYKA
jgi:hypothetical protein